MHTLNSPKNIFLIGVIAMLSITALVGIALFIRGEFGIIEGKILATTAAIGGFSLAALCGAFLYERNRVRSVANVTMTTAMVSLIYTLVLIWEGVEPSEDTIRAWGVLLVVSFSLAHASLLLLIRPAHDVVRGVQYATLAFITLVALIVISLIVEFEAVEDNEVLMRTLGVFGILDGLGTIVTPLVYVMYGRS